MFFMQEKVHIERLIANCIDKNMFLVDLTISKSNQIKVFLDSVDGIKIEDCIRISRCIEGQLNRDEEDFELEVSSPGLDHPFKVVEQYRKNIGKEVEVVKVNGEKLTGVLKSLQDNAITLLYSSNTKNKKQIKQEDITEKQILLNDIKSTKLVINF